MKRKKVYNLFQINLITLVVASVLSVPMLMVVAYIFDLQNLLDITSIFIIASIISAVFITGVALYLVFSKDRLKRKLKPSYHKEFSTILIITALGILGIGITFIYLGGALFYVPHVIIPLFIFTYLILFSVGDRFFNVKLFRK